MKHLIAKNFSFVCTMIGLSLIVSGCSKVHPKKNPHQSQESPLSTITTGAHESVSAEVPQSRFECKNLGNGRYRPYYLKAIAGVTELKDYSLTPKGLLGQNPMSSLEECSAALKNANHQYGVICSRTGLDGWKPTLYTGTVPGRADFGYLGGSSIVKFEDCLKSTASSSEKGVCFWGGSAWFAGHIDREGSVAGPFSTVDRCVESTKS